MATRRTRRSLFTALGLTAAGATAAGIGAYATGRDPEQHSEPSPSPSPSPPPPPPRFDLAAPGGTLMAERLLTEPTVMQSFAVDSVNRRLFAAQLVGAGRRFDGESAARTGTERARAGDLCISEITFDGLVVSSMYLLGFGHGVQIGVEPAGAQSYLWTEATAFAENGVGWGRQIARTAYRAGAVVYPDDPEVHSIEPVPGATRIAIGVDVVHRQAALRFRLDNRFRFVRADLDALLAGDAVDISASIPDPRLGYPAQGFATFGEYLYVLEGGTEDGTPEELIGTSYISRTQWRTGHTEEITLVTDGSGTRNREPEGLALYQPDPTDPGEVLLCFGIGTGAIGNRLASIYYRSLA